MAPVDLAVGVVIAGAVVGGFAKGLVTTLPLSGAAVGAVLGTRVPLLLGVELHSASSLVVALPASIVLGALLGALVERFGLPFAHRLRGHAVTNAIGGALVAGAAGTVVVWILGPVAAQVDSLRHPIEHSNVLARFDAVLTPAGLAGGRTRRAVDNFPTVTGPPSNVAPADARALTDPDVKRAERSVVKIIALRCKGAEQGSGWFAAPGVVVTNAHVVAFSGAIAVRLRGTGAPRPATAIWFDRVHDVALLRVPELRDVQPLTLVRRPRTGTPGAALGFPKGVKAVARARLETTTNSLPGSLEKSPGPGFKKDLFGRLLTPFRGIVRPGNSGGPLVDRKGRVLTTVFAQTGSQTGAGVANRTVRGALGKSGPPVTTGGCQKHPGR